MIFKKLVDKLLYYSVVMLRKIGLRTIADNYSLLLANYSLAALLGKRRMKRFYSAFVGPRDLVFDVGANVGNRTGVFLRLGARVVAVDPQPVCVTTLRRKFGSHANATIVPQAVGSAAGDMDMFISSAHVLSTLSKDLIAAHHGDVPSDRVWPKKIRVSVTTLDALVQHHGTPRFCKIDVEGFEDEVIGGLSCALPALSLEFHPQHHAPSFRAVNRLAGIGPYEFNFSVGETFSFLFPAWVDAETLLQSLGTAGQYGDIYARLTLHSQSAA